MHARFAVAATAAAALLLTAAPTPAGAQSAPATVYGGSTSQGAAFVLRATTARRRSLRDAVIWIDAQCADGTDLFYAAPLPLGNTRPRAGRRFTVRRTATADYGTLSGAVTARLTGTAGATAARGTLDVTVALRDRASRRPTTTCRTRRLTWRATSAPRRVFGGATSDGRPVVVELRADRRRVRTLRIGWTASCQPPAEFGISDTLSNLSLSPAGRFGNVFSSRFPIPGIAGAQREFAYDLSGRVRAAQATGTLSVTVTDRDEAQTVRSTCRAQGVRFTAASSPRRR